jgi:hypothetical protein
MEARGADSPCIERVPFVSAFTKPSVFFAGRPAAERASDARAGGVEVLLLIGFTIHNDGLVILDGAHARLPRSRAIAAVSKSCSGIREFQS